MQIKVSFPGFNKKQSKIEVEPAGIIFDKRLVELHEKLIVCRSNQKAYEILGIDVSTQKLSQVLGASLNGWTLPASQLRAQENIKRRLERSPGLSRKALKVLGIEEDSLCE